MEETSLGGLLRLKHGIPATLHTCSGPDRDGSYAHYARLAGHQTLDVDICIDPALNVCHDDCWDELLRLADLPQVVARQGDAQ